MQEKYVKINFRWLSRDMTHWHGAVRVLYGRERKPIENGKI